MPVTFTDAEKETLRKAIASGALTVRYADRTVTYRDLGEMERILQRMEPATRRQIRLSSEKGFDC